MWASASLEELRAFWTVLSSRRRYQVLLTLAAAILCAGAEMIGLALTYPWVAALFTPDTIRLHGVFGKVMALVDPTPDPHAYLITLTLLFGVMTLITGALRMVVAWAQIRLAYTVAGDFSGAAFRAMLARPYEEHISENSSVATSTVTRLVELVTRNTILPALSMITSGLVMAALLATVVALVSQFALYLFCALAAAYGVVWLLSHGLVRRDSEDIPRHHAMLVRLVNESVGSIREIIIDQQQPLFQREFDRADRTLRRVVANAQAVAGVPRFGIEALALTSIAAMAYFTLRNGQGGGTLVPTLGLLALCGQRMLPLMQTLFQGFVAIRSSSGANRKLLAMLMAPPPEREEPASRCPLPHGDLLFDQVTYTYPTRTEPTLRDISFTIPQGARVGVTGPTGAGKSTLLDLVLNLLTPQSGLITVGGRPLDGASRAAWHARIAHVPQDVVLIDASIAENIAFGVPLQEIAPDRLRMAAERAQILGEIEAFPDGFATLVGERGALLSGGQRQRVGIARALYKGGSVFVLDEATSALDLATEARVLDALLSLPARPTVFMISHRPGMIAACDHLIELDGAGGAKSALVPPRMPRCVPQPAQSTPVGT